MDHKHILQVRLAGTNCGQPVDTSSIGSMKSISIGHSYALVAPQAHPAGTACWHNLQAACGHPHNQFNQHWSFVRIGCTTSTSCRYSSLAQPACSLWTKGHPAFDEGYSYSRSTGCALAQRAPSAFNQWADFWRGAHLHGALRPQPISMCIQSAGAFN